MELRRLKRHVMNYGGLCEAWLVYALDFDAGTPAGPGAVLRPRLIRAFWTRAEAAEWVGQQSSHNSHRYETYRVALDERWVSENSLRPAHHVALLKGGPARPSLMVTPGAIAHAFR
jgi:hypothetical protein